MKMIALWKKKLLKERLKKKKKIANREVGLKFFSSTQWYNDKFTAEVNCPFILYLAFITLFCSTFLDFK